MENLKESLNFTICPNFYRCHILKHTWSTSFDCTYINPLTFRDLFWSYSLKWLVHYYTKLLLIIDINLYLEIRIHESENYKRYLKLFRIIEEIGETLYKWRDILNG